MLSIIYSHRNRDLARIERSLRSLQEQSIKDFEVYFVDYGSKKEFANEIELLLQKFTFVKYQHYATYYQPWNKSRALNSVIKNLGSEFCFVADIDMIFHQDFVKTAISEQQKDTALYFQVGFLNEKETQKDYSFENYKIEFKSTDEATGLTMFPVKGLKSINGFDEFYHFWGAEDTDVHIRLKNAGYKVLFYDKEVLMLHQWHPSYRSKESKKITSEIRLTNAVRLNHQHLKYAQQNKTTKVNKNGWGIPFADEVHEQLFKHDDVTEILSLQKEIIDHFLFHELTKVNHEVTSIKFKVPQTNVTKKYLKRLIGKSMPKYYSLKDLNDMLLTHIVCFYRDYDYIFKVNVNQQELHLKIRKPKSLK